MSEKHRNCGKKKLSIQTFSKNDGLAMGASLATILANLWLKQYETALSRDIPEMFLPEKDLNGICPECSRKVTYRSKGVDVNAV